MSQQQRDTNLARPRLQRVLPHLVTLIAGGTALWGWGSVIGADLLKGPVIGLAYLVVLMFAPVIGASAVTYSQGRAPQEERHRVLIPYVWWAIAGLGSLLLLILAGMNPRSTAPAPPRRNNRILGRLCIDVGSSGDSALVEDPHLACLSTRHQHGHRRPTRCPVILCLIGERAV